MKNLTQILCGLIALIAITSWGAQVHVIWQISADGQVKEQGDDLMSTGEIYTTCEAPRLEGYVFTGWTINTKQAFVSRDAWGRSFDSVSVIIYEPTVLTANYHLESVDSDGDGLSDAREMYWYGNLDQNQYSDLDEDGFSLLDEFTQGLNPHLFNRGFKGLATANGTVVDYNPNEYPRLVIRCEPEGELFPTEVSYVKEGENVTTSEFDSYATRFAYWAVNDVRQTDAVGRALNAVTFSMPNTNTEVVAVCEMVNDDRARLHWYGDEDIPLSSDTDTDGRTLSEELASGTNPLLKDRTVLRGVTFCQSGSVDYNPNGYPRLTVVCDPEGVLFAATSRFVKAGTFVNSQNCRYSSGFFGWTFNGVRQHDVLGRALDEVSFNMPPEDVVLEASSTADAEEQMQMYWYGNEYISIDSDTDGDGYSLAVEVAAGTNPLLKDRTCAKGIVTSDTPLRELDIQPYEQPTGVLVGERYVDFFSSPMAGKDGRIFAGGAAIWPVVWDVDLDGLWDLVVVSAGETNLFLNVGSQGNPKFVEEDGAEVGEFIDLMMNSTEKLDFMTLDVPAIAALSATTNGATMLVSDEGGRIWYYVRGVEDVAPYQLQHKVWGGSFDGFAKGLKLAVVDWEDDGDLDCICGTAEGKLILLRDPKAGRPTGLEALTGVDNVKLNWDPNEQPRVKGYKVYRGEGEGEGEQWSAIGLTSLPTYRDWPEVIQDYQYRVTSLSRFYVAGSSTPVENESVPSEIVKAELGKVAFLWTDAAGFVGKEIPVSLGVENSLNLSGEGMKLVVTYNAEKLQSVRVEKSGLTTGVTFTESAEGGVWTIQATGGTIEPGGGTLFTFVFKGLKEAEATPVALTSATLKSVGGADVPAIMPSKDAQVAVEEMKPAYADIVLTDSVVVKSGDSFKVDVSAVGERIDPATLTYDFVYDRDYFSRNGNTFVAADVGERVESVITVTNVSVKATDGSEAKIRSVGQCVVTLFPKGGEESRHLAGMKVKDVWGETDEIVAVPIGICSLTLLFHDTILDISGWEFEVRYSDVALEYVGYEAEVGAYSCKAEEDFFGRPIVSVKGKSGSLNLGRVINCWKYPIKLLFKIKKRYAFHSAILNFGYVAARASDGWPILTPVRLSGEVHIHFVRDEKDPTVVVPYSLGDVNGDGVLSKEDEQLLARLMNGGKKEKWTADELRAGDYNGNGKLDQGDYQLMKEDFKGKGIK